MASLIDQKRRIRGRAGTYNQRAGYRTAGAGRRATRSLEGVEIFDGTLNLKNLREKSRSSARSDLLFLGMKRSAW